MRVFGAIGLCVTLLGSLGLASSMAVAADKGPDTTEPAFRALYKELVETNTTLSSGDCTVAARQIATRMKAAGFADADLNVFTAPGHPKEGGLIATLHGRDPKARAILLLAHVDVVEARRADWTRDPFTLVEENGYFYGRGTSDDKAMAAAFADNMIRYKQEGFRPRRDVKLALTCGEENGGLAFDGAEWLVKTHKDLIDAEFALNEGAGGTVDATGKRVFLGIQAGEKVYQDFRLEATNPGGHSSLPHPDNAIYHVAVALARLSTFEFPIRMSDTTRAYFTRTAPLVGGEAAAAMTALVAHPDDRIADAIVSRDPVWHSMLRTTCVATLLEGGHAANALPQRAAANVNCRIFPGMPVAEVQATLARVVDDDKVTIIPVGDLAPTPPAPPLTARVLGPAEAVAHEMWPGVPVLPMMSTGATDGSYLNAGGIPTYGLSGMFTDASMGNVHGLNERMSVQALMEGRQYLYRVVKLYADGK